MSAFILPGLEIPRHWLPVESVAHSSTNNGLWLGRGNGNLQFMKAVVLLEKRRKTTKEQKKKHLHANQKGN